MHAAVVHLAPILGAEKSKVPFYIAGGLLVAWALIVSLGVGMRREDFPGSPGAERAVISVTAVLVVATIAMAVATSGGTSSSASAAAPSAGGSSSTTTPGAPATQPTATSGSPGTPAPPAGGASTALKLVANPSGELKYNTKTLTAKAGTVTITMANMSPLEHNVTIAQGSTVLGATPTFVGGTKSVSLTLKPGTYTFYCSVPGHRQAGMEGTLTVS